MVLIINKYDMAVVVALYADSCMFAAVAAD